MTYVEHIHSNNNMNKANGNTRLSSLIHTPLSKEAEKCKTQLGCWLDDRFITTAPDDDLSLLTIHSKQTDIEVSRDELVKRIQSLEIKDSSGLAKIIAILQNWCHESHSIHQAYGDSLFEQTSLIFKWPDTNDTEVRTIKTKSEYFDLCARKIIALNPKTIEAFHSRESPPDSALHG